MLKRPIEGTKGPAQSTLLMITHSKWRILRSWTDYRQSGSNDWAGDLCGPCLYVGGPRRCEQGSSPSKGACICSTEGEQRRPQRRSHTSSRSNFVLSLDEIQDAFQQQLALL